MTRILEILRWEEILGGKEMMHSMEYLLSTPHFPQNILAIYRGELKQTHLNRQRHEVEGSVEDFEHLMSGRWKREGVLTRPFWCLVCSALQALQGLINLRVNKQKLQTTWNLAWQG